jgi:pimeloyl-ACP methyl ester carboxylesterase
VCGDAVPQLLGDEPDRRARQASPIELVPLGVPQRLVCGALDRLVPNDLSRRYAEAARRAGDDVQLEVVAGVGHFELVDPRAESWRAVRGAVRSLLR